MKSVTSKVKLNTAKIRQLDKGTVIALEKTIEALKTDVVQAGVMPFDVGTMQDDNTFTDYSESKRGKVSLNTTSAQARRLYFHPEYSFQTKENPNAQGNWLESWISGKNKDFCKNAFVQFYKREIGL